METVAAVMAVQALKVPKTVEETALVLAPAAVVPVQAVPVHKYNGGIIQ